MATCLQSHCTTRWVKSAERKNRRKRRRKKYIRRECNKNGINE
jgi:hypothetical protein